VFFYTCSQLRQLMTEHKGVNDMPKVVKQQCLTGSQTSHLSVFISQPVVSPMTYHCATSC